MQTGARDKMKLSTADLELISLCANKLGHKISLFDGKPCFNMGTPWNPLDDDGDCFRAFIRGDVSILKRGDKVTVWVQDEMHRSMSTTLKDMGKVAQVRRLIVRAIADKRGR